MLRSARSMNSAGRKRPGWRVRPCGASPAPAAPAPSSARWATTLVLAPSCAEITITSPARPFTAPLAEPGLGASTTRARSDEPEHRAVLLPNDRPRQCAAAAACPSALHRDPLVGSVEHARAAHAGGLRWPPRATPPMPTRTAAAARDRAGSGAAGPRRRTTATLETPGVASSRRPHDPVDEGPLVHGRARLRGDAHHEDRAGRRRERGEHRRRDRAREAVRRPPRVARPAPDGRGRYPGRSASTAVMTDRP